MVRLIVSSLACVLIAFPIARALIGEGTVSTASFTSESDSLTPPAATAEADASVGRDFDGQFAPGVGNAEWRDGSFGDGLDAAVEAGVGGRRYSRLVESDIPGQELLVAEIAGASLDLDPLMYANAVPSEPLALWGAGTGAAAPAGRASSGGASAHGAGRSGGYGGLGGYGGVPADALAHPDVDLALPLASAGGANIPATDERGLSGDRSIHPEDRVSFRVSDEAPGVQGQSSETAPQPVPEPMSLFLFGTGASAVMLLRRRLQRIA